MFLHGPCNIQGDVLAAKFQVTCDQCGTCGPLADSPAKALRGWELITINEGFVMFDENMSLGTWEKKHGANPDNWPLPSGQPMRWKDWARALHLEAVARGWDPAFWRPEITERDLEPNCWAEDWLAGKSPAQTADEHHASQLSGR